MLYFIGVLLFLYIILQIDFKFWIIMIIGVVVWRIAKRKKHNKNIQKNPNVTEENGVMKQDNDDNIPEIIIEDTIDLNDAYISQKINYENRFSETISANTTNMLQKSKFSEMRKIVSHAHSLFYDSEKTAAFYKQAEFMKDYEDDYTGYEPFQTYRPTYNDMNNKQLRTYFTWRTNVRNGVIKKTDQSYVYVYLYELINGVSFIDDKEELLRNILSFWNLYRAYDDSIDRYLKLWVKDFYVVYDIKTPFEDINALIPQELRYDLRYTQNEQSKYPIKYLGSISTYKFLNSKFYASEYGYLMNDAIAYVFEDIEKYILKFGYKFEDIVFYKSECREDYWYPFSNAVFYDQYRTCNFSISLPTGEKYRVDHENRYVYHRLSPFNPYRGVIGYVIKLVESELRRLIGYKYKLSPNPDKMEKDVAYFESPEQQKECIKVFSIFRKEDVKNQILQSTAAFFQSTGIPLSAMSSKPEKKARISQEQSKQNNIDIDTSKFEQIRKGSDELQQMLVIDDEMEHVKNMPAVNEMDITLGINISDRTGQDKNLNDDSSKYTAVNQKENEYVKFINVLNGNEKEILHIIVAAENVEELLKELSNQKNIMIETTFDSINEKSLEFIADNIIETNETVPYVYGDYIEEIKNALKESGEK